MSRKYLVKVAVAVMLLVGCLMVITRPAAAQTALIVTSGADSGPGSLRQALIDANASPGVDTVKFDILGSAPHVIALLTALPDLTEPAVIDGTTQPDYEGSPVVRIDGANVPAPAAGFHIEVGASTLRGLAIVRFENGIVLRTNGENRIESNFIGIDTDGSSFAGNRRYGILIWASANNQIGGGVEGAGNVISSNEGGGLRITQVGSQFNKILGNVIGADANGNFSVGNAAQGVLIDSSASFNVIGDSTELGRNVISGNEESGLVIRGAGTLGNQILGNLVGVNKAGDDELPNNHYGILLEDGASENIIGHANVISRNGFSGVAVFGALTRGNRIVGNYIGTDRTSSHELPNDVHGILIEEAGGTEIGGPEPGDGNTIAYNQGAGINILSGVGNRILGNAIFGNNDTGIDLGSDGATDNDLDDADEGANNLQNFPALLEVGVNPDELIAKYRVDASLIHAAFPLTVQFFAADERAQGSSFIGEHVYTAAALGDEMTYANLGSFTGVLEGDALVATATDSAGNTSEFSPVAVVGNITSVATVAPVTPTTFVAYQNYPNPFNPETVIPFEISDGAEVRVDVYNVLGERINTVLNAALPAGEHQITWTGTNTNGLAVASGIYLYHLQAGGVSVVRKMTLLR